MNRKLHRMGPHQAFSDEWGLEGFSWLLLAPPGSSWLLLEGPNPCNSTKRNLSEDLCRGAVQSLSLIHISEPTRHLRISYAVFCLKKKNK